METWRDISVIIAMLVANGLAIMTYYRWTKRQGKCSADIFYNLRNVLEMSKACVRDFDHVIGDLFSWRSRRMFFCDFRQ